jgi:hypothetical protein
MVRHRVANPAGVLYGQRLVFNLAYWAPLSTAFISSGGSRTQCGRNRGIAGLHFRIHTRGPSLRGIAHVKVRGCGCFVAAVDCSMRLNPPI